MKTRQEIIARICSHLPFATDPSVDIGEESKLTDLGVNSLHLITLLLTLQEEYSINAEHAANLGMPTTVGELVTFIEQGNPPGS